MEPAVGGESREGRSAGTEAERRIASPQRPGRHRQESLKARGGSFKVSQQPQRVRTESTGSRAAAHAPGLRLHRFSWV